MYNLPYYKNKFNFEPENTPHADRPIGKRILLLYKRPYVSMLSCVCSATDHRRRQSVVGTKKNVPRRTAECDDNVLTEGKVV